MDLIDGSAAARAFCKRCLLGVVASLVMGGCQSFNPKTPEDVVRERAKERWTALVQGDLKKAYEFTAPSFRALLSADAYRARIGGSVTWTAAEVVSVACEAQKCTAVVRIDAKPLLGARFGNTLTTHVDETWLLEEDRWWFFQKL